MGGRDPALIVRLRARGNSGAIGTNNGNLVGGVNLLRSAGGTLRALAALATTLLLGEEGGDPGVVDEVRDSAKGAKDNEVEEDAERQLECE
jgi:hypothetical protein